MLFIAALLQPSSPKEGILPAQQPDVTCNGMKYHYKQK